MTQDIFEDREKVFETKYAKNQEQHFRKEARAVNLFALWSAFQLGLKPSASTEYASKILEIYIRKHGLKDVIAVIKENLEEKGIKVSEPDLENRLARCQEKVEE